MHEAGFKTALTRVVNDYAHKAKILKDKDDNLSGEDIREGITAVVSVKHLILSLKVRLRLSLETQMLELQSIEHFQKRLVVS